MRNYSCISIKFFFALHFNCTNDLVEMRKLRKMGHITIVGPSMPIVKARLDSMLSGKSLGGNFLLII